MSTELVDAGDHWVVKTVEKVGKRRRMGRSGVAVPKDDPDALRAEIIRQGEEVRRRWLILQGSQEPVV